MKLTKTQLERLLEIAESNTIHCYREHCAAYGEPDQQTPRNHGVTEMYQGELSFIIEIKEQEGIQL